MIAPSHHSRSLSLIANSSFAPENFNQKIMKLFVVAAVLGVCLADRLDNKYLPPRGNAGAGVGGPSFGGFGAAAKGSGFGSAGAFGAGSYNAGAGGYNAGAGAYNAGAGAYNAGAGSYSGGNAFGTQYSGNAYNAPAQTYNSRPQDAGAQILRQNSEVNTDSFSYDFETSNSIRADAHGVATNGVQEQGSFAYKGDDGQEYSITYTADENGYQPRGAHLPTPPPIPEEILKSLEQNARDEAAGIVDDGSYHGEGAGAGAGGYSGNSGYNAGAGGYNQGAGAYNQGAGAYNQGAGASFNSAKGYNAGGSSFGKASFGQNNFGAATSRQYLAPNAGGRGSGNFNPQTGYNY